MSPTQLSLGLVFKSGSEFILEDIDVLQVQRFFVMEACHLFCCLPFEIGLHGIQHCHLIRIGQGSTGGPTPGSRRMTASLGSRQMWLLSAGDPLVEVGVPSVQGTSQVQDGSAMAGIWATPGGSGVIWLRLQVHFFSQASPRTRGLSIPGATMRLRIYEYGPIHISRVQSQKLQGCLPRLSHLIGRK